MPSPRPSRSFSRILAGLAALAIAPIASAQEAGDTRVRYDLSRAIVVFERGSVSPEQMERFAGLANKGIEDIDLLLNHAPKGPSPERKITFIVRDDIPMSRSFRRTVMLPADRVRRDTAPYLHETTHVIFPMKQECLWLSEGFASYVQSYVAERLGGYDGYVFSWGGNPNIDRLARRTLDSDGGRNVVTFIGGFAEPSDLFEKRREVAQPLYVLSHSMVTFMVDQAGLERVMALVRAADIAGAAEALTGRTIDGWKADWLEMLSQG